MAPKLFSFRFGIQHLIAAAVLVTCAAALMLAIAGSDDGLAARTKLPLVRRQRTRIVDAPGFYDPVAAGTITEPGGPSLPKKAGAAVTAAGPRPRFVVMHSPKPSPLPERYHMRRCSCVDNWKELKGTGQSVCECGGINCPAHVDPVYLTNAIGQDNCSLKRHTGYDCYASCTEAGDVLWFAVGCGENGGAPCPPLLVSPTPTPSQTPSALPTIVVPRTTWDPTEVYDFRGGGCELLNGEKRCYMEDAQGRELCPKHITPEYLENGPPEYPQCRPEYAHQYYCTMQCQEGNDEVRWGVHDIEDCHTRQNFGNCPPRPSVIPKKDFKWREWTEKKRPDTPCQAAAKRGEKGGFIPQLTIGLLTHEPRSFGDSMETYRKYGLFDMVNEFIIYVNGRSPAIDAVADKYRALYPDGRIKVMGDSRNYGIARGLVSLTNASSNPYFLFLERDFQLIEPSTCVYEQLMAGIQLVKEDAAQVIRYRSRWRAGRPNWAVRFFRGHEDDAFRGGQPNLGCNVHYWVEDPEKRWPQYFWECGKDPQMLCSDAYYCNWTNNPQLWSIDWWNREYVSHFDEFLRVSPWDDLESYMNWEPNSWNDRGFVVAQGDGLFKHMDRRNIVHV